MANGDFDEYGQVFQKIGEKFKWSGKRGPLEKGDFDEYGEFGENGEFGKNGDYGKKITIDDALIYKQILLRNSLRKSMEISLKNFYLDIGA